MTAALPLPAALLVDYGGVLVETRRRPDGIDVVAKEVVASLHRRGLGSPPLTQVLADVRAGLEAWERWKARRSRDSEPRDVSHQEFWSRLVTRAWDEAQRRAVVDDAFGLCRAVVRNVSATTPMDGARELLETARELDIAVAVVSNALSGQAHRELLEEFDLADLVDVQLYSDEVGIRKPNPQLLRDAAAAVGTEVERCWYVGDQHDRDVLAGRRAGAGVTVLVRSAKRPPPEGRRVRPDLEVASVAELHAELTRSADRQESA